MSSRKNACGTRNFQGRQICITSSYFISRRSGVDLGRNSLFFGVDFFMVFVVPRQHEQRRSTESALAVSRSLGRRPHLPLWPVAQPFAPQLLFQPWCFSTILRCVAFFDLFCQKLSGARTCLAGHCSVTTFRNLCQLSHVLLCGCRNSVKCYNVTLQPQYASVARYLHQNGRTIARKRRPRAFNDPSGTFWRT